MGGIVLRLRVMWWLIAAIAFVREISRSHGLDKVPAGRQSWAAY